MYLEDRIFGPFTFKQFLVLFAAGVVGQYVISILEPVVGYVFIAILAATAIVAVIKIKPKKIPLDELEQYLQSERGRIGKDAFKRKMQKRAAEIQSQIYARKMKGKKPDVEMEKALTIIQPFCN